MFETERRAYKNKNHDNASVKVVRGGRKVYARIRDIFKYRGELVVRAQRLEFFSNPPAHILRVGGFSTIRYAVQEKYFFSFLAKCEKMNVMIFPADLLGDNEMRLFIPVEVNPSV
jgi:hypothetical protein